MKFARKISAGGMGLSALGIFTMFALVGCGHSESVEERELAKMQDEITRIQIEHDQLDKRVDSIEMHTGAADSDESDRSEAAPSEDAPQKNVAASSDASSTPTPQLRVVHLDADGSIPKSDVADDPNDSSVRPVLQLTGTATPSRSGGKTSADSFSRKTRADAAVFDPQAKRAYDQALALALGKKYDEALDAFAAFLVKWPDHPNADNATYWRGECYFAKGNFDQAAEQFEGVIARFPFGNKVPDALLKLGATYEKLGDAPRSQQALDRLQRDYPRSEAARKMSTNTAKKSEKSGAPSP